MTIIAIEKQENVLNKFETLVSNGLRLEEKGKTNSMKMNADVEIYIKNKKSSIISNFFDLITFIISVVFLYSTTVLEMMLKVFIGNIEEDTETQMNFIQKDQKDQ